MTKRSKIVNEQVLDELDMGNRIKNVQLKLDKAENVAPKKFRCQGLLQLRDEIQKFSQSFPHKNIHVKLLSDGKNTDISIEIKPVPNIA